MINRHALLADLQKILQRIEADLLERSESTEVPEVPAALHAEYEKAAKAERTAQNYEDWRTDTITQAAAAWVLSCVFVRFLEDNSLVDPPKIAGPGERLARARDEHELYFRSHPKHTDREYLLAIFGELAKLPGTKDIFGEHNAINDLPNWLSGDAAGELLNFFQKIDASTGDLVHDFTDPNWDTRFLGDLYQDLSEDTRKKFALLQTPDFVEEFILDRTLEPALDEFGLVPKPLSNEESSAIRFKMIDPACGSGHFLLGSFPRLLDRWQRKEPGTNIRELTQRALDSIHGVDINPFAVAIAKIRLLLSAMKACNIRRLAEAPGFHIHVACGDSLLHGENRTSSGQRLWDYAEGASDEELYSHAYPGEDLQTVRSLLKPGTYHCVVANPPYIVPKDRKLNEWYRRRFSACAGKYSLSVPFMQQIFQLSVLRGFTGQITSNSFMKREFGKKLIESFIPKVDLTHVIDTSGAFIPGHGTPTTILFGRNCEPTSSKLRTVFGIRGEPSTPEIPSNGLVWTSIANLIDNPGHGDSFVSVQDSERVLFSTHPWSIGGGGASELKELMDSRAKQVLNDIASTAIGIVTLEDDAFASSYESWLRRCIGISKLVDFVEGDRLRDWQLLETESALFPYDLDNLGPIADVAIERNLWPLRTRLKNRIWFRKTQVERGLQWFEYGLLSHQVFNACEVICFASVATHNHFVLSDGGKAFKQSAPVIQFSFDSKSNTKYSLLGLLNSSSVAFWIKQVFYPKATTTGDISTDKGKPEANRYDIASTGLAKTPIPYDATDESASIIASIAEKLDGLGKLLQQLRPKEFLRQSSVYASYSLAEWEAKGEQYKKTLERMVALQEELDWEVYRAFGLSQVGASRLILSNSELGIPANARPFSWDSATIPDEVPPEWHQAYVQRRKLIEQDATLGILEDLVYKRPWWGRQGVYGRLSRDYVSWVSEALRDYLLWRLELVFDYDKRLSSCFGSLDEMADKHGKHPVLTEWSLTSISQLADLVRADEIFMRTAASYRNDTAFDVVALVEELTAAESVPLLPILRYKESGLRKRAEWESAWDLQRRDDSGEPTGTVPVPPEYKSSDFISTGGARYWSLRGKLDVPKERWLSFPHCEGPDGTLVICWAGYDHLQQAQAISAYYVRVQTEFGGSDDPRLIPLLASLIELLPWLKQWHNEPNANFDGLRMGDYFEGFVNEEARNLGKTLAEIKAWVPPVRTATRSRKKVK